MLQLVRKLFLYSRERRRIHVWGGRPDPDSEGPQSAVRQNSGRWGRVRAAKEGGANLKLISGLLCWGFIVNLGCKNLFFPRSSLPFPTILLLWVPLYLFWFQGLAGSCLDLESAWFQRVIDTLPVISWFHSTCLWCLGLGWSWDVNGGGVVGALHAPPWLCLDVAPNMSDVSSRPSLSCSQLWLTRHEGLKMTQLHHENIIKVKSRQHFQTYVWLTEGRVVG